MQRELEDPLAEEMLRGNITPGAYVTANLEDERVVFSTTHTVVPPEHVK